MTDGIAGPACTRACSNKPEYAWFLSANTLNAYNNTRVSLSWQQIFASRSQHFAPGIFGGPPQTRAARLSHFTELRILHCIFFILRRGRYLSAEARRASLFAAAPKQTEPAPKHSAQAPIWCLSRRHSCRRPRSFRHGSTGLTQPNVIKEHDTRPAGFWTGLVAKAQSERIDVG